MCLESLVFFSHHHRHFASTTWRPWLRTGIQEAWDASKDASRASGKFFFSLSIFFFLQLTINRRRYAYSIRDEGEGWGCEHRCSGHVRYVSSTEVCFFFFLFASLFNLLMKFYYRLRVTTTKGKYGWGRDGDGDTHGAQTTKLRFVVCALDSRRVCDASRVPG